MTFSPPGALFLGFAAAPDDPAELALWRLSPGLAEYPSRRDLSWGTANSTLSKFSSVMASAMANLLAYSSELKKRCGNFSCSESFPVDSSGISILDSPPSSRLVWLAVEECPPDDVSPTALSLENDMTPGPCGVPTDTEEVWVANWSGSWAPPPDPLASGFDDEEVVVFIPELSTTS